MEKSTIKLTSFLKEQGCVSAKLVTGPNGDFVSALKADGTRMTLPVGKKSQGGKLSEMNVLITDDDQPIATMNNYTELDSVEL